MLTVIDNYDSFTYNLVQYLRELGAEVRVLRNDECGAAKFSLPSPTGTDFTWTGDLMLAYRWTLSLDVQSAVCRWGMGHRR